MKKFISISLSILLILSTVLCGISVNAADYKVDDTVTYKFLVTTDTDISAYQGSVSYPADKLAIASKEDIVVYDGETGSFVSNDLKNTPGKVLFNASSATAVYKFDNTAMMTITFNVIAEGFDPKSVTTTLEAIYDPVHVLSGNIPFSYKNVVDDVTALSGYVDLDNPENSYVDPTEEPTSETTEPTTESSEPTTESTEPTEASSETEPVPTESTEAPTLPAEGTFHVVAGAPELCNGVNWDPASPLNLMTLGDDGVYSITYTNVPAGDYIFKVTTNGAWDIADYNLVGDAKFGGANAEITVTEDNSTVLVTFKESDQHANAYINGVLVDMGATEPTKPTETESVPTVPTTEPTTAPTQATEPTTKPQTIGEADETITNADTDNGDPKGSTFGLLRLNQKSKGKTKTNLIWTKVKGAKGYIIYGAKCGKALKKIKTVSANTTKYTVKNLKKGTYYKYLVVAYKTDGNSKVTCAMSKVIHATTKGGKYGNPTKITKVKDKVIVKKGKKITLKPSFKYDKKVKKHVGIRYESTNTKVATVSSKGVIKGVTKNKKCTVYVYAQNGVYKKVTVSVK